MPEGDGPKASAAPQADGHGFADEAFEPRLLSSERVFEGKVWDVRREVFDYNGSEVTREFVDHTGAVGVLAMDEQGRVLLIQQYRHPVRTRDWEIPAGLLDVDGEDPLTAAKRELGEEVDLGARTWNVLADFVPSPGGNSEVIRIYLARDVYPVEHDFTREEEEADMQLRWVDLDDLVEAALARRVQNAPLIIGALAAQAARARGFANLAPGDEPWPRRSRRGAADR
ncbi:NUDIX hydrolase [Rathayibacter sp. YIM 133350]|uniref:NUDIX hydrolase n=1 Tax=Rathayibacter sp. YIM 133350 TaxID=3131992 RepID=UPI00307CF22D